MPFRKGEPSTNKGMTHWTDDMYRAKLRAKCVVTATGCWEIQGFTHKTYVGKTDRGYGGMSYRGKNWRAHRLSYFLHYGSIDPKLDVMHSCDNPPCLNPEHLSLGTRKQNIQDAIKKRRGHKAQLLKDRTHCPRGHAYAEHAHLSPNKGGWVQKACKMCGMIRYRRTAGWPEHRWNEPSQRATAQRGTEHG